MSLEYGLDGFSSDYGQCYQFAVDYGKAIESAEREGRTGLRQLLDEIILWVVDTRNFKIAWDHLVRFGGQAPGPDGLTCADVSRAQSWELFRFLRELILSGEYRHQRVRRKRVPKRFGRGHRVVHLANLRDRLVSRAISQILRPLLDGGLSDCLFCRPRRGPWQALAHAQVLAASQDRWMWLTDDIQDAFDQVPRERLFQIVQQRLPSGNLIELLRRVMDNGTGKGLRQGSSLSSMLMLVYLDHFAARPWQRLHPTVPLLLFMDDILLLAAGGEDATNLYMDLEQLLACASLPLKGTFADAKRELFRGDMVSWLGYQVKAPHGQVEVRLAVNGRGNLLDRLADKFVRLHAKPDAPKRANEIIKGLLTFAGPAFPYMDRTILCQQIASTAKLAAFEEIPAELEMISCWEHGHSKWSKRLQDVQRQLTSGAPKKATRWRNRRAFAHEAPF